jgi:hypothetical protein
MAVKRWLSAAGLLAAVYASAATGIPINQTLPFFNSGGSNDTFPVRRDVGVFSSIPLGESLISGGITGTFGNDTAGGGSVMRLFLGNGGDLADDVLVATCPDELCRLRNTAWSHEFTNEDLLKLARFTGPLAFFAEQETLNQVRLGPTTLTGVSEGPAPVPEPGTLALVGLAVVGFAAARRRRSPA